METGTDSMRMISQNVVYMRAKPMNDCEQVSQQWMGCTVRVLREENGWAWIESDDTYRGWVDMRFLIPVPEATLTPITAIFAEVRQRPDAESTLVIRLPMLAGVEVVDEDGDWKQIVTPGGALSGYVAASAFAPIADVAPADMAAHAAKRGIDHLGTPYLWGGSSPFGIDCSGFAQRAYRLSGLNLRRDADIQRSDERFYEVSLDDPLPGDLILFGTGPEKITHIGLMLGDGTFIHSAGGSGVIITPVGDDRYWPKRVDGRRLDPARAADPIVRYESDRR